MRHPSVREHRKGLQGARGLSPAHHDASISTLDSWIVFSRSKPQGAMTIMSGSD